MFVGSKHGTRTALPRFLGMSSTFRNLVPSGRICCLILDHDLARVPCLCEFPKFLFAMLVPYVAQQLYGVLEESTRCPFIHACGTPTW
jgi:hypothetical protein